MEALELKKKAAVLRKNLIELIYKGGTGHTGGDLSVLNVLTTLYYHTMNVDAKNPKMENRDRFILSKGHCAEALYTILCDKGFIEQRTRCIWYISRTSWWSPRQFHSWC